MGPQDAHAPVVHEDAGVASLRNLVMHTPKPGRTIPHGAVLSLHLCPGCSLVVTESACRRPGQSSPGDRTGAAHVSRARDALPLGRTHYTPENSHAHILMFNPQAGPSGRSRTARRCPPRPTQLTTFTRWVLGKAAALACPAHSPVKRAGVLWCCTACSAMHPCAQQMRGLRSVGCVGSVGFVSSVACGAAPAMPGTAHAGAHP